MPSSTSIRDFYKGRSVLVTGGTGLMGKVLVEKLLYSVPDIGNIYIIMRPKKGKSVAQRLETMQLLPIFDRVRNERPNALKKLKVLQGDVLFEDFGLSATDIENLSKEVSAIFHFAATLRLEAPLRDNVNMNTCGTLRTLNVARRLKNLLVFVHLSTAFCYPDYEVLDEKMHPPPVKPEDVIKLTEWLDDKQLALLTPSLLGPHPNSYTFSKRLAETVIHRAYPELPVVIARPSIVILQEHANLNLMLRHNLESVGYQIPQQLIAEVLRRSDAVLNGNISPVFAIIHQFSQNDKVLCPAYEEPVPGWVDNLNGPVGLMLGAGKGVIRTMLCDGSLYAQVIPVDIAINALIAIGMIEGSRTEKSELIPVYNVNIGHQKPTTWGDVLQVAKDYGRKYPLEWPLWYPNGDITTNKTLHEARRIFYHLMPAYFIDFLMFIFGQKRFMVRIQERISQGLEVLQYFTMRPWSFPCKNYDNIQKKLNDEDKVIFNTDITDADRNEYMRKCVNGGRVYCLKEDPAKVPINRAYHNFLYVLDWIVKICFWLLIISFLASWFTPVKTVLSFGGPVVKALPFVGSTVFHGTYE